MLKLQRNQHALLNHCAKQCVDQDIEIDKYLEHSDFRDKLHGASYVFGASNPIIVQASKVNIEMSELISTLREQLNTANETISSLESKVVLNESSNSELRALLTKEQGTTEILAEQVSADQLVKTEQQLTIEQLEQQIEQLKQLNIKTEDKYKAIPSDITQPVIINLNSRCVDYLAYLANKLNIKAVDNVYPNLDEVCFDANLKSSLLGKKYEFVQQMQQQLLNNNKPVSDRLKDVQASFTPEKIQLMATSRSGAGMSFWNFIKAAFNLINPFAKTYYETTHSHSFWQPRSKSFSQGVENILKEEDETNEQNIPLL